MGTTGGGPDIRASADVGLNWDELARDLRLARHWIDQVYVHHLEGRWQGFLGRLRSFDWSDAGRPPAAWAAQGFRRLLQAVLWSSAHQRQAGLIATGLAGLLGRSRKAAQRH